MKDKTHYQPKICDCPLQKAQFEMDWEEALQDWKRLKALQRHYQEVATDSLPLEYGHVLILKETLKTRFLTKEERQLLNMLCLMEGIDYSKTCYQMPAERNKRLRGVQMDMFPHLYEFRMPMNATEFGKSLRLR